MTRFCLCVLSVVLCTGAAHALDTGWTLPGQATDLGGGDVDWKASTLPNITTVGPNVELVKRLGRYKATNKLLAHDYGFQIPANATINGVQILYQAGGDLTAGVPNNIVRQFYIALRLPTGGTSMNFTPPGVAAPIWSCTSIPNTCHSCSSGARYHGGNADTWGLLLTPAIVNSPDFGYILQGENWGKRSRCAWMDHMQMKVFYTVP